MRDVTAVLRDGMWSGRRAFVVGSGPSLQGFDRKLLTRERTIGINEEWRWTPTIALHSDLRLLKGDGLKKGYRDDEAYLSTKSIKVYHKAHPDQEDLEAPDFIFKIHSSLGVLGRTLSDGLCFRANAGLAGLNLACILGADPIYLMGFDCGALDGKTHSHAHYPPEWRQIPKAYIYKRWAEAFAKVAPGIKARVVNLCPSSGIECFEKQYPFAAFMGMKDAAGRPEYTAEEVRAAFGGGGA